MAQVILQSAHEKHCGVHYTFDTDDLPIGEGGMGKVYKGLRIDEKTGATREVAIKFMNSDLPESAYERARREAGIQLRNDNLVEMLGFIETEERNVLGEITRRYHVVSELLTGVCLSDIFEGKTKDRDGEDVPFAVKMLQEYKNDPEHFAITVVRNVLSGLMALHDAGYIHRDIDPSNIMLTTDGHIKLIDFGIAKQMNTLTTSDKQVTVAGKFMGKPDYAAPELALGDIRHQNQTTDIYAVGILLYQCIIGHTPFEGPLHEVLEMQISKKVPLQLIKSKSLRNIISMACEKKQELRYQTAAQMRVALETLEGVGVTPALSPKKKLFYVGGAFAFVVLLALIAGIVRYKQEEAKAYAEASRIEQMRTKLESDIEMGFSQYQQGLDSEIDDYEHNLILAYKTYNKCLSQTKEDVNLASYNEQIKSKMDSVLSSILDAKELLLKQAREFEELEELDASELYKNRADSLEIFLKSIN